MKKLIFLAAAAAFFALPRPAEAGLKFFSGSAGVLVTAGGDIWTKPESNYNLDGIPFGDTAGGYGVGGGVFFEARFIRYIGLEWDVLFEYNNQWYSINYNNGAAELKYSINYVNYRLPFLVKAVIPAGIVRFSIGLGPEFVFSRGSGTDIVATSGQVLNLEDIKGKFHSEGQNDVYLSVALGFAFKVWRLSIPLNLRYAYNLTQPKKFEDRMQPVLSGVYLDSATLVASETMDLRLMIGLAYDF
jgi:hypothetical protein